MLVNMGQFWEKGIALVFYSLFSGGVYCPNREHKLQNLEGLVHKPPEESERNCALLNHTLDKLSIYQKESPAENPILYSGTVLHSLNCNYLLQLPKAPIIQKTWQGIDRFLQHSSPLCTKIRE